MRTNRISLILALAVAGVAHDAAAQIFVGPQGSALLTFNTAPPVREWATQSFGGDAGGGGIVDAAGLDAQVQTVSIMVVTNPLASSTIVPPAQNNYARWNSSGQFLQSRIGNVEFTVLMATLVNNIGYPLQTVGVSYDLRGGLFSAEQVPGFRGYYSLTGQPGSWVVAPGLCTGTTGLVTAVFTVQEVWFPNAPLYVLWADDNGAGSDGYYTVDNLRVSVAPALHIRATATGRVEVLWPQDWWNHQLEATGILAPPDWRPVIGFITRSNGFHHMSLDAAGGSRYLRSRGDIIVP